MSAADVARSERVLNAIGGKIGLTTCGRDWLIGACDPYHDAPLSIMGYPDVNEAASVTQVVKFSAQISAPTAVPTGNWDCHIHQFPWLRTSSLAGGVNNTIDFIINSGALSASNTWGGLAYDSVAPGAPTFHYTNSSIVSPFDSAIGAYTTGEFRLIGMGFEVINTTSELNVQGLVTTYRYPMPDLDSAKTKFVGNLNNGTAPVNNALAWLDFVETAAPPDSASGAMLLEGSRQWKAKEGVYVVPTLNSSELPTGVNNCAIVIDLNAGDTANGGNFAITTPPAIATLNFPPTTPSVTIQVLTAPQTNLMKFNHSGAYFQGLAQSTTLQVNAIYIFEKFPTALDTSLVVLAKPSCRADHAAIELYSEIIRQMPVAVPQRMNGLGEWFSDAVSAASDFLSPVLSAIPHPYAQGASMALKGGAGALKKVMGSEPSPGQIYSAQPQMSHASKQVVVVKTKKKAKVAKPVGKKKK